PEDGKYTGIRIGERLPRSVDVEKPQRSSFEAIGPRYDHAHPLLDVFAEGVDRGQIDRLPLRRRHRLERRAVCRQWIPCPGAHGRLVPTGVGHLATASVHVQAFAVDAHGGRYDEPAHGSGDQFLQQDRRAEIVDRRVPVDLIHALPDAHSGGQVKHAVDPVNRAPDYFRISDIAGKLLHAVAEISWPAAAVAVYLFDEII